MTLEPGHGHPSSRREPDWRPASIVGRSLGFGAATGAVVGFVIALVLSGVGAASTASGPGGPSGLEDFFAGLLWVGAYAVGIGAIIGVACGFVACIPLLLAQECARVSTRPAARGAGAPPGVSRAAAGLIAGTGAALLPLGFAIRGLLVHSVSGALVLAWLATVVFFLGLLLGPYVVYGSAPKRRKPTSGTRARVTGADRPSGRDGTGDSDGTDLHSAR
ncbi:MAG TPA: hypothetical protein VGI66_15625 [Streptosporangiaceae bacterium]|jgi:hypothetical protein